MTPIQTSDHAVLSDFLPQKATLGIRVERKTKGECVCVCDRGRGREIRVRERDRKREAQRRQRAIGFSGFRRER